MGFRRCQPCAYLTTIAGSNNMKYPIIIREIHVNISEFSRESERKFMTDRHRGQSEFEVC